ncbi:GTP-binding protein TypA/BipA like protein [Termitomyces sp. J132]|nr:GTP-binding protein TypA/BipA like protein [Termitomyces sp. J132]
MAPLFDLILVHVPPPMHLDHSRPFSMLTIQIGSDPYVGMLYVRRMHYNILRMGDVLCTLDAEGQKVGEGKVKKIFARKGLDRIEKDAAGAGEIVSVAGVKNAGMLVQMEGWGEEGPKPLPVRYQRPLTDLQYRYTSKPTLAGTSGSKLTSQLIREHIYMEAGTNVALRLPSPVSESLELCGNGVLHLGVLLEMLREGFELAVGPPKAVMIPDPDAEGRMLEPIEECTVLVRGEYAGAVVQKLTIRKGEMVSYETDEEGWVKVVMDIPARGLIGYMAGEFGNDVHGQGICASLKAFWASSTCPTKCIRWYWRCFVSLPSMKSTADTPTLWSKPDPSWYTDVPMLLKLALAEHGSLFDFILVHVPPPIHLDHPRPFSMLTVQIERYPYVGMLYVGRIHSGILRVGDVLCTLDAEGQKVGEGKVKKIFARKGLDRIEKDAAGAGEIVSVAGVKNAVMLVQMEGWGEEGPKPLPVRYQRPLTDLQYRYTSKPTLAGTSGSKLTSQLIREHIYMEAGTNVALRLPSPVSESLELCGNGVLHLGVLLEMLREGFELAVGPPKAVMIPDPDAEGRMLEPIEECTVLVRGEYAGAVVQKLTIRKGEMVSYETDEEGWVKVVMDIPARGLIGYMAGEFGNDVHGQGTINHIFKAYMPYRGAIDTGRNGALISMAAGETSGYALAPLQARGTMFVGPGEQVYPGMIIGESSKPLDLHLNPCVKKQLTNIRSVIADDKIVLSPPRAMSLEEMLAYVGDDELVEVTPGRINVFCLVYPANDPEREPVDYESPHAYVEHYIQTATVIFA